MANQPSTPGEPVENLVGRTPAELNLKHGDMLFITYADSSSETVTENSQSSGIQPAPFAATTSIPTTEPKKIKQLSVDDTLDTQQGLITRKRTSLCRHSDQGMCEYCSPLPPWDKDYLQQNGIKHKSFHAHLNELNQATNKQTGTSYIPPLKEESFEVAKKCTGGHKPWPEGICSKCQPSAVTLQPQDFRMVDHVEFADSSIINSFIDTWRETGTQRIGYLYGRYEEYPLVPLGIKAVVEAIYEPPQHDELDGITLSLPWENEKDIDKVANACGLSKVGVVFTDLLDAGHGDGTVVCKRHKDSYFLSSLEVIFAAQQQIKYPNFTKHSASGIYSSKFVTCVISGNLNQEIEVASYQVSASAEALAKADLISGSTHPSMVYINEKTHTRYVPDIFYKKRNQYNIVVKENAKPAFPNDYLLVTLTHGFPQNPTPQFVSSKPFSIENRQFIGVSQDLFELARHLNLSKRYDDTNIGELVILLSDFHLLSYLFSLEILSKDEEKLVAKIAITHDVNECFELFERSGWKTLLTIVNSQ